MCENERIKKRIESNEDNRYVHRRGEIRKTGWERVNNVSWEDENNNLQMLGDICKYRFQTCFCVKLKKI